MKAPNVRASWLAMAIPLLIVGQSWAAEQKQAEEIEEVVVWGTEIRVSSLGLDEEAIAIRQADHISDLLRTLPGVDVGGAHSLNQRITIRSMDDKDLRISIDGANQNTYMYHHMGNLQIHADILKSVDISVGNNSVVNGGLGGSVRFETREARDLLGGESGWGGRLQGTLSDNASNSFALTTYGTIGDAVDALLYYNSVDRDNYEVGGGKILDENGLEVAGTHGEVQGLEGELSDVLLKVGWNLSENQRLKLGYEAYQDEGDYSYRPDMGLATDLAIATMLGIPLVYPTEFSRDTLTLNYDLRVGDMTALKFALFSNTSTFWRDERGLASWRPPFATINEGEATNTGLNVLGETPIDWGVEHRLTYGGELIDYDTQHTSNGVEVGVENAKAYSVFIEDRISVSEDFVVIPGLRYDSYDMDAVVVEDTFSDLSFAFAAEYSVSKNFLVHASTTQLFKAPELGEVFIGAGAYDTPNPEIKEETGVNNEVAFVYQQGGNAFGLTVFDTNIKNYIYDYTAAGKDNVGDMIVTGFETYLEFNVETLSVLATYSSAKSDLNAFPQYADLEGARVDRQQGDTFSVNLDYEIPDLNLKLHWDFMLVDDVDAGLDLDGATLNNAKDGFNVHNISVRWAPEETLEGFAITFGVDNLFDEFYASQSSRTGVSFHPLFQELYLLDYEPGRNVKATVAYQF